MWACANDIPDDQFHSTTMVHKFAIAIYINKCVHTVCANFYTFWWSVHEPENSTQRNFEITLAICRVVLYTWKQQYSICTYQQYCKLITLNFLNLQLYLSAMISSQSALLLVILASSLILTCHSQIKLTPCLSLVIFISETFVVFVISFLFLQLQRLPIHSSPANLIIVIHSTMAFRKLTWTKYSAYKILWLVSLQIHQNLNTLHQYSKNYIGFQSNNASITNCVFLHIKRFKFSNLPIFTIVFLFLLTLCLQDHLIHRFCPFHMSKHLWVKGSFLSLLQGSGTPSHPTPVTRYLFLHSAQNSKPIFLS